MEKSWNMPSLFACRFLQRNNNHLFFWACNKRDVYYVLGKCWVICLSELEDVSLLNSPKIHEFNLVKLGISGGLSNLIVIKAIKKQMLPWLLVSQGWPPTEIWGRSANPNVLTFLDFAWFSQSVTLKYITHYTPSVATVHTVAILLFKSQISKLQSKIKSWRSWWQ